ncbi:MAG: alpha/beta hydrolase [Proteobacteria bacterium]|nr:alpha/beta hydrolase [Pseudomonadota bacterium]
MSTINRTTVSDLRGAARLAVDATLGITTLVEKMHHTIQLVHPPLGASRAESTRGLTGLIYRSIRGTTRVIGKGLDAGLIPVAALLPEGAPTEARNAWVSAINGVYGDHLERTANPLAIEMSFLHESDSVDPECPGDVVQDASGKVLLAIHGLCLNEQHWARDGHHRIAQVAEATGHTIVQLRYNSGRSIDANGRSLAVMLEALLERWPVPVTQLAIVGHSMGGLVARSAIHHGATAGHSWRARLRKLFSLGSPHHGAPLERGGNRLDYVMELSPYVAPFTSLGKARSAGITDLRYGSITDVGPEAVPLPDDVECYALAATLGKRRGLVADRLIGDGLVPLDSALGRHPDSGRTLAIPKSRQWIGYEMGHLDLLGRPEVYSQLEQWLR